MTVRLAIVGAGVMGADHVRIFAERLPDIELRVICDPDRGVERLRKSVALLKSVMPTAPSDYKSQSI